MSCSLSVGACVRRCPSSRRRRGCPSGSPSARCRCPATSSSELLCPAASSSPAKRCFMPPVDAPCCDHSRCVSPCSTFVSSSWQADQCLVVHLWMMSRTCYTPWCTGIAAPCRCSGWQADSCQAQNFSILAIAYWKEPGMALVPVN